LGVEAELSPVAGFQAPRDHVGTKRGSRDENQDHLAIDRYAAHCIRSWLPRLLTIPLQILHRQLDSRLIFTKPTPMYRSQLWIVSREDRAEVQA
jgi:hypothetical protein